MAKLIDLTGKKFGKLKVIRREGSHLGVATWFCECECGGTAIVTGSNLRQGNTKSCGCLVKESAQDRIKVINRSGQNRHNSKKRTVGKRIEFVRKSLGVSSMKLSARTGIAENDIIDYECDEKSPSFLTAMQIANALGVSVSEFASWDYHAEL